MSWPVHRIGAGVLEVKLLAHNNSNRHINWIKFRTNFFDHHGQNPRFLRTRWV